MPHWADGLFGLEGKHAVVIGGGFGIGRVTCELLGKAGVSVAVVDVDEARARSVTETVTAAGGRAVPIVADVLAKGEVDRCVRDANAALGSLEILVTVVGMPYYAPIVEMADEAFDLDIARNLRYVFQAGRAFARLPNQAMQGRAIVAISSIASKVGAVHRAAYGVAKAGLNSLIRTMAAEWGPIGIRANALVLGIVRTDSSQIPSERRAAWLPAIPVRRIGDQMDVAKAVLFLASDMSSYTTGHSIPVDGGVLNNYPLPPIRRHR